MSIAPMWKTQGHGNESLLFQDTFTKGIILDAFAQVFAFCIEVNNKNTMLKRLELWNQATSSGVKKRSQGKIQKNCSCIWNDESWLVSSCTKKKGENAKIVARKVMTNVTFIFYSLRLSLFLLSFLSLTFSMMRKFIFHINICACACACGVRVFLSADHETAKYLNTCFLPPLSTCPLLLKVTYIYVCSPLTKIQPPELSETRQNCEMQRWDHFVL